MNKIFLGGLALTLCGGVAFAQEINPLFPELKGQFEQAPAPQPKAAEQQIPSKNTSVSETDTQAPVSKSGQQGKFSLSDEIPGEDDEAPKKADKNEGNLIIQVRNVDGVLPYARTLAYCTADAVLTNETNRLLEQLSLTVTYKDMPKDLNYSGVSKKKSRTQKFMMIGLPCESINGMPEVEIKTCKLKNLSEEACKKRVQFLPPGG